MTYHYEPIFHTNSSDDEERVVELYSSKEEPKSIISIVLFSWNNEGRMAFYREREKLGEIPTGATDTKLPIEIPVNLELPEGQRFTITLKNKVSGTNASVVGYVKYQIK